MKKVTLILITIVISIYLGVSIVIFIDALVQNKRDAESHYTNEDTVVEDTLPPDQSVEEEDTPPEYLSPEYEKDIRESFEYNVDLSDVGVYSLPMDVPFLVTEDSHDGSDGYINICYMTTAYVLQEYFGGNVDGVYTYAEDVDVTLIGDTSSIYEVRVHGPKELSVTINGFDNKAVVKEVYEGEE